MKLILMRNGAVYHEYLIDDGDAPPFYRLDSEGAGPIGLHIEAQLAPRYQGEYYALWGKMADGAVIYVHIEPGWVMETEWWLGDVLCRLHLGVGPPPPFLSVFPGNVVVPQQTPGDTHDKKTFYVLSELESITPWRKKAIYKRAEVVYYQYPPARPLKRLLDL